MIEDWYVKTYAGILIPVSVLSRDMLRRVSIDDLVWVDVLAHVNNVDCEGDH
jgi:hypothetical protein